MVSEQLTCGVVDVYSNGFAFVAVKSNGAVVAWGDPERGGEVGDAASCLSDGITSIYVNRSAFAALKASGEVITWGSQKFGGDSRAVAAELRGGAESVVGNGYAFAALKCGGSVVTWGDPSLGGDVGCLRDKLSRNVVAVYANRSAFAAMLKCEDGDPEADAEADACAPELERKPAFQLHGEGCSFAVVDDEAAPGEAGQHGSAQRGVLSAQFHEDSGQSALRRASPDADPRLGEPAALRPRGRSTAGKLQLQPCLRDRAPRRDSQT
eukprot:TRINITY_DN6475_c0_g1_i2.p1 TRINITY_DN6475_c0_g1~~TRINITY_DN6475_c0_g1_i2.p1  ORF type:complete len:267 (+),score=65.69 TRINITY_DN6475_c0_g1_i2:489-1289(+)